MKTLYLKIIEKIDNRIVKSKKYFHIPNSTNKLLYIDIKTYSKEDLILPNGGIIKNKSLIGEIHVDNQKIKGMDLGFKDIKSILKDEFDSLSLSLINDSRLAGVQAFYARTILYAFLKREGFTLLDINVDFKVGLVQFWTKTLRLVYSKNTIRKSSRNLKDCWITHDELLKRKIL